MLYPSELLARRRRSSMVPERATCRDHIVQYHSIRYDSPALARIPAVRHAVYPTARERISLASFSISSVFFSINTERTLTASVFSTSAFSSLANW
jgi:hypothetical protein